MRTGLDAAPDAVGPRRLPEGGDVTPKPYYQDERSGITIYHGDCREILPDLLGLFDLLLTDPPYGIRAAKRGAHSSIRDCDRWPEAEWDDKTVSDAVAQAVARARLAMVWGGNYYTDVLPPSSSWLAWIKPEAGTGFSLADMELCWTNLGCAARVRFAPWRDGHAHLTQKPVAVMAWCIALAPKDMSTILDPFMGFGTTLRAAKDIGRCAIGIEIEERYCEIAANRMRQGVLFGGPTP